MLRLPSESNAKSPSKNREKGVVKPYKIWNENLLVLLEENYRQM